MNQAKLINKRRHPATSLPKLLSRDGLTISGGQSSIRRSAHTETTRKLWKKIQAVATPTVTPIDAPTTPAFTPAMKANMNTMPANNWKSICLRDRYGRFWGDRSVRAPDDISVAAPPPAAGVGAVAQNSRDQRECGPLGLYPLLHSFLASAPKLVILGDELGCRMMPSARYRPPPLAPTIPPPKTAPVSKATASQSPAEAL